LEDEPSEPVSDPTPVPLEPTPRKKRAPVLVLVLLCVALILAAAFAATFYVSTVLHRLETSPATRPANAALTRVQIPIVKETIDKNSTRFGGKTSKDATRVEGRQSANGESGERVVYDVTIDDDLQPWYFYFNDVKHPSELGEINAWVGGSEIDWTPDDGWRRESDSP